MKALPEVLSAQWDNDEFKAYRDAFPDDAKKAPDTFQAYVEDLTKRDVKIAHLKNLQGYLWENGYKTGAYSTPLFPDVVPKLKQWREAGIDLAIYSSGSVFAQKLLFGHVASDSPSVGKKRARTTKDENDTEIEDDNAGPPPVKKRVKATLRSDKSTAPAESVASGENSDIESERLVFTDDDVEHVDTEHNRGTSTTTEDLQYLMTDWYDTVNAGLKTEADSYQKIAGSLKVRAIIPLTSRFFALLQR